MNDQVSEPQGNYTTELEWSNDQYPSEEEPQKRGQEETDLEWSDDLYQSTNEESDNDIEETLLPSNKRPPLLLEENTSTMQEPPNHPLVTGDTLPMPYSEYLQYTQTKEPTKQMIREFKRLAPYNKPDPAELEGGRRRSERSERK
jgi:hypothetical protein